MTPSTWQPVASALCTILGGEHRGRVAVLLSTPDGRAWHARVGSAEVQLERAALGPPPVSLLARGPR